MTLPPFAPQSDVIPAAILADIDTIPIEDVALPLVRAAVPGIRVESFIPMESDSTLFPFVMVQGYSREFPNDDDRWLDSGLVSVQVLTEGADGDQDASLLSAAIRRGMRRLSASHFAINEHISVVKVTLTSRPRRTPDWATSQGPVQYADLPSEAWRYEAIYRITFRKKPTSE